jgi:Uma2 family endonuclease
VRFYYPDASVICRPDPPDDSFQDEPAVIAEVLSETTRRIDEGEKKDFYLTIGSLSVYLLVESTCPIVTLYRRTEQGFQIETYPGLDAVIPLSEIGIELPLAEVYRGVEFAPEIDDEAGL